MPNESVVPIVAMMAAIFLPSVRAFRAASSSRTKSISLSSVVGYRHQVPRAEAEPTGDVGGAVVPGVRHQDDGVLGHAVVDRIRAGLLQPHLDAVEGRAGAAEGEHAAGPVPDRSRRAPRSCPRPPTSARATRRLYSSQAILGLCNAASSTPMTLGMVGGGMTFCCVRGWPKRVMPRRYPHQIGGHRLHRRRARRQGSTSAPPRNRPARVHRGSATPSSTHPPGPTRA